MMFSPYSECTDLDRKNQFMSTDFLLRYNFYSDFLVMYDNSMFDIFSSFTNHWSMILCIYMKEKCVCFCNFVINGDFLSTAAMHKFDIGSCCACREPWKKRSTSDR